jgi:tetratricopeptide (TPR) repeat protein
MRGIERRPSAQATGEAAVAVAGDNSAPILTNPTFILSTQKYGPPEEPRLLPPAVPDFTGREQEIGSLETAEDKVAPPITTVISGKPGVGKTTLAVRIAYRQRGNYTRGALYADLRGADKNPASPEEIMGRFLKALGVPETEIPGDQYARLDAYRSAVADRSLVIILDNAADESQVRPLMPPGDSALTLITSRSQLSGLESVHRIDLETFRSSTSLAFLRKVIGDAAVDGDMKSAIEVVQSCGHLPLALRIAANRYSSSGGMSLSDLATELRDQREVIGALEAGDLAVRAAFNLSYRRLGKGAKNTFKRLSSVPGVDFGAGICSALIATDERQANKMLLKLREVNLIEPAAKYGRYKFHDLLKAYSRELAEADSRQKGAAATDRMLDWLQHSALKAHFTLIGQANKIRESQRMANINSVESAAAWIEDELPSAIASVETHAGRSPEIAALFALSLTALSELAGNGQLWEDALQSGLQIPGKDQETTILLLIQQVNLGRYRRDFRNALNQSQEVYRQAKEAGNSSLIGQAAKLHGALRMDCGQYNEARPLIQESLGIFKALGMTDEVGQALYNLGTIHRATGNITEALACFEEDLRICTEIGDELGSAETANTLALAYADLGDFEKAERLQRQALAGFERLRNPYKVSMVCNDLGVTLRRQGKIEEALKFHFRDREMSASQGNQSGEALALANIAETYHALGRLDEAQPLFSEAISTLRLLGDELRLARTLTTQIALLFDLEQINSAEDCAAEAAEILTRHSQLQELTELHNVLANEFFEVENYDKSLTSAKESLRISEDFDNPYLRAVSLMFAARSSGKLDRSDIADGYLQELQGLCNEHPGLTQRLKHALQRRGGK